MKRLLRGRVVLTLAAIAFACAATTWTARQVGVEQAVRRDRIDGCETGAFTEPRDEFQLRLAEHPALLQGRGLVEAPSA